MIYTAFNESNLETSTAGQPILRCNTWQGSRDIPRRKEPAWMKRGLSETASGYGHRLNTGRMIHFGNRWRRVYCARYGNSGTLYFRLKGRNIVIQ